MGAHPSTTGHAAPFGSRRNGPDLQAHSGDLIGGEEGDATRQSVLSPLDHCSVTAALMARCGRFYPRWSTLLEGQILPREADLVAGTRLALQ